ncbi:hypothetical protein [Terrabacter sp. Ter38]|uniref:hypothetical protein n=1 Tax=Terrabacter sp. Ter38 TaxID=2926030 RepID=UPI0021191BCD|nr:hypothetical protein [Terrabacter sp. Ter38]
MSKPTDASSQVFGSDAEVAWINAQTGVGRTVTSAIPPVFEAYCTVSVPADPEAIKVQNGLLVETLTLAAPGQWWIGFLETGISDVVFQEAPRIRVYNNEYVLVRAGAEDALRWRADETDKDLLPDLMFPPDRSWLVSTLWDDDWRYIGGPAWLIRRVAGAKAIKARPIELGEDSIPAGHTAI